MRVGLSRPEWEKRPQSVLRLALGDGARLDRLTPSAPVSLVRRADGLPAFAPARSHGERSRLRIRRGSRIYFRETVRVKGEAWPERGETWLSAADWEPMPLADGPREPAEAEVSRDREGSPGMVVIAFGHAATSVHDRLGCGG
ncbi:hypothetical protein [Streptomyces europaeiscabiei]|uniref:hypothetical protein n=1 Tax=Streptomyces europaeiscabiei TaxID=146819 RepID=UPI0029AE6D30|nr:hypothetical protein [Streptomyces europaeiscabiei]MDX3708007.1 hypothetical protein [Streptomyces europaeiscabiei]MDX3776025.1 hypothetical protein [Streptomyces europaeiscabiei]MDX3859617.1 hypothetical protein [Streptomyces europaeiscabiei]MDX3873706.1 hypothetical protein [Streptomyces europaeiscabiei]